LVSPIRAYVVDTAYTRFASSIEYLINPERMAELRKALLDLAPDHKNIPPHSQVLLASTR
jgi:hypothetical protein